MLHAQEGIAIAEICVYAPIFFLTLITLFRHGIKQQSGWVYLAIFCLIRIAGAVFKIENINHPNDESDEEWAGILQSVGLSPLLLASLGLLKRVIDLVSRHIPTDPESGTNIAMSGGRIGAMISKRVTATSRRSKIIQLSQLPIVIGLILCIVGGTDATSSSESERHKAPAFTKVGIAIFLVAYIVLALLVVLTVRDANGAPAGEKRLYGVIVVGVPLLGIRLLWSLIAVFGHCPKFQIAGGNYPWINFGMAVVEEFLVACMYTIVGLTLGKKVE